MVLTDFDVFEYALPFAAPLRLRDQVFCERRGLLLRLVEATGAVGWGDIAPLPGFSRESLETAREQVRALAIVGRTIPGHALEPAGPFAAEIDALCLTPSVRFGLEGAVLDLLAQRAGQTPLDVLGAQRSTVALNGLLTGGVGDVLSAAQRMREAGYRAVKLKVGQRSPEEDAGLVCELAGVLGPGIDLRLDANRAWSMEAACRFVDKTMGLFSYLEEPLFDATYLADFGRRTGAPLALDETLVGLAPASLKCFSTARAVVLKPMLLGGIVPALRMARAAHALSMTAVVSGSFESGVGLRTSLALAAVLGDTPAGLDTYRHLASDVLYPRLAVEGPSVDLDPLWSAHRVEPGMQR